MARVQSPEQRAITGRYGLLYKYLANRYANTVVLTFSEIEDLLGFALPPASRQRTWWTDGAAASEEPAHSDSWVLASRTAAPNLTAQTVTFERTNLG
jgi:hypothetical protein